jgi:hypothetical protein
MKIFRTALVALVCLSTAAFAQGRHHLPNTQSQSADPYVALAPQNFQSSERITHNANDCPPDRAEAVWGAGSALLGYTCVTPNAN